MASGFLGGGMGPRAMAHQGLPNPVPVAGAELLTNGGFESWTSPTDADNWTETLAGASTIEQDASIKYAGSYAAKMTFASAAATLAQTPVSATGQYLFVQFRLRSSDATRGLNVSGWVIPKTPVDTWSSGAVTERQVGANKEWTFARQDAGTYSVWLDDVSILPLTLASLLSTRAYASADCDLSAAVTRTAGTQAGLVARLDSATSPANFILAYLDGAGNVKADKCVGGTYTAVLTGAVSYVAGKVLRLVCSGNDVSVYYDGAQVGVTTAVADAGITSNVRHGKFSTYAANVLASYVAA